MDNFAGRGVLPTSLLCEAWNSQEAVSFMSDAAGIANENSAGFSQAGSDEADLAGVGCVSSMHGLLKTGATKKHPLG